MAQHDMDSADVRDRSTGLDPMTDTIDVIRRAGAIIATGTPDQEDDGMVFTDPSADPAGARHVTVFNDGTATMTDRGYEIRIEVTRIEL